MHVLGLIGSGAPRTCPYNQARGISDRSLACQPVALKLSAFRGEKAWGSQVQKSRHGLLACRLIENTKKNTLPIGFTQAIIRRWSAKRAIRQVPWFSADCNLASLPLRIQAGIRGRGVAHCRSAAKLVIICACLTYQVGNITHSQR